MRTPVPCPSEIAVNYSLALINAISLAFNNVNLNFYIELCMTFLETSNSTRKPKCIIRIDITHIIKTVYRWKCFNGKHMRVKDFYVRCFGLLTKCICIDQFRQICRDILTVNLSDTEDITDKQIRKLCFTAQQRLIQLIKMIK